MTPHLARRREIWLPTAFGWLVLALVLGAVTVSIGAGAHPYLSVNEPVGARILVVEGWMDPGDLDQAAVRFRTGRYERILTTGGPTYDTWASPGAPATFAERAAEYLRKQVSADLVVAVPAADSEKDRTYTSALAVRTWAKTSRAQVTSLDVFSKGVHARRSRILYRLAFGPQVAIGIFAAAPADYDPATWWQTSYGAEVVLKEVIGLLWVECCFWPPPGQDA